MVHLLNPSIKELKHIESSLYLTDSLTEISENENEVAFLDSELQDILKNKFKYKKDASMNLKKLEIYYGIYTDLVVDMMKFQNRNKKDITNMLKELTVYLYDFQQNKCIQFLEN
mmetsp:Transcript_55773/g.121503  ORF Transcript_55773/g.121503 Transcript_55773/m.121503 type:complete len:114 (+) Transcript_55773:1886-2227(+)